MRKKMARSKPRPAPRKPDQELDGLRLAMETDPAARAANVLQLRRARGQIDGIDRMIREDRYCADVIVQIIAARASLQAVARDLLKRHLEACHRAAARNGGDSSDAMYQELVDLVTKMAK